MSENKKTFDLLEIQKKLGRWPAVRTQDGYKAKIIGHALGRGNACILLEYTYSDGKVYKKWITASGRFKKPQPFIDLLEDGEPVVKQQTTLSDSGTFVHTEVPAPEETETTSEVIIRRIIPRTAPYTSGFINWYMRNDGTVWTTVYPTQMAADKAATSANCKRIGCTMFIGSHVLSTIQDDR